MNEGSNELYYAMCQKCQTTKDFDDGEERDNWAAEHEAAKPIGCVVEKWDEKVMVD